MTHVGDIAKLSGYGLPPVDVITGGSPCQDLSIAGKRAGLAGARSGLFMEQIRVIKELRDADRKRGRAGVFIRPRFMVWENVPGAFSSNSGEDFKAVLEETIRIAEPDAPDIPLPGKGKWPMADAWYGEGWSVAYRVLDAQFWGVPQRRRRIALVADFGGHAAPEILFVRQGVSGDFDESGTAGEEAAGSAGSGADRESGIRCLNPWDGQTERVYDEVGVWPNLRANNGGGQNREAVMTYPATALHLTQDPITGEEIAPCLSSGNPDHGQASVGVVQAAGFDGKMGAKARSIGYEVEKAPTLTAEKQVHVYDARGNGDRKTACTITGDHENRVTDYTALCVWNGQTNNISMAEQANTLDTMHDQQAVIVFDKEMYNSGMKMTGEMQARYDTIAPTCRADTHPSGVCQNSVVRRLTPLECERLQGYPDGWTDIGEWTDSKGKKHKEADSPRYRALGNSIALPPWKWVLKRISAQYERDATLGSLFDGIGGFPLIWEQINGKDTALWASEIKEFPIAVTNRRFNGR